MTILLMISRPLQASMVTRVHQLGTKSLNCYNVLECLVPCVTPTVRIQPEISSLMLQIR